MEIGSSDDQFVTSSEFGDEEMLALTEAIIGDGKCLIPAGANKHFNMIAIQRKFQIATKKKVETRLLWEKLNEIYDLATLDSRMPCPFPNDDCEFSLPENDFSQLMRDRKSQSSQDKSQDEESRDSGSGRETPPTLAISKRGSSVHSGLTGNKRKHSTSISDAGSDAGSTGRKSTGGTKSKRRI